MHQTKYFSQTAYERCEFDKVYSKSIIDCRNKSIVAHMLPSCQYTASSNIYNISLILRFIFVLVQDRFILRLHIGLRIVANIVVGGIDQDFIEDLVEPWPSEDSKNPRVSMLDTECEGLGRYWMCDKYCNRSADDTRQILGKSGKSEWVYISCVTRYFLEDCMNQAIYLCKGFPTIQFLQKRPDVLYITVTSVTCCTLPVTQTFRCQSRSTHVE